MFMFHIYWGVPSIARRALRELWLIQVLEHAWREGVPQPYSGQVHELTWDTISTEHVQVLHDEFLHNRNPKAHPPWRGLFGFRRAAGAPPTSVQEAEARREEQLLELVAWAQLSGEFAIPPKTWDEDEEVEERMERAAALVAKRRRRAEESEKGGKRGEGDEERVAPQSFGETDSRADTNAVRAPPVASPPYPMRAVAEHGPQPVNMVQVIVFDDLPSDKAAVGPPADLPQADGGAVIAPRSKLLKAQVAPLESAPGPVREAFANPAEKADAPPPQDAGEEHSRYGGAGRTLEAHPLPPVAAVSASLGLSNRMGSTKSSGRRVRSVASGHVATTAADHMKRADELREAGKDLSADEERATAYLLPLLEEYKVQYWYWEAVEIVRKLCLAGLLGMIKPVSVMQVSAGTILCFAFAMGYISCRPFARPGANLVTITLNIILFLFFFLGLQLKVHLLNDPTMPLGSMILALFICAFCTVTAPLLFNVHHASF